MDIINHVTGFYDIITEVMHLGKRIWYLKRGLSNLFGARAEHDMLPKRLLRPIYTGPSKGSVPDIGLMLKEFYELRGFNDDGVPKKEILEDLGLSYLAKLLYKEQ